MNQKTVGLPIGWEKLREEIAREIFAEKFRDTPWGQTGTVSDESWRSAEKRCLHQAEKILSLIQPLIEEARRELYENLESLRNAEWMVTADWCNPGERDTLLKSIDKTLRKYKPSLKAKVDKENKKEARG